MRRPASEEAYEFTAEQRAADEPIVQVAPQPEARTPAQWVRRNLFSTPFNSLLTVVAAAFLVWVVYSMVRFIFVSADWTVLKAHLRVYMVGRFPLEEIWRVWTVVYLVALLAGMSRGLLPRPHRTPRGWALRAVLAALMVGVILYLVESALVLLLLGAVVAVFLVGAALARLVGRRLRLVVILAWIALFPVTIVILRAFGGVPPQRWGGFLLNMIVAVVAIFVSFPIGILLALGRRSAMPVLSSFCVGLIETVRGVPLVTLLVFGIFVLPLLLPPAVDPPNIVLAMVMFVIFSSAYVAEITRGGLQGVQNGQFEASRALGLPYMRMMALVVLPQALRNTIPAMISHFISLFKDTSLLAALAFFSDLLSVAGRSTRDLAFVGQEAEALLPAAFVFWVVAYSMARWSQRVERRVGVGER